MFPTLTTERLVLQQIVPVDQAFIFEGLSHPEVIRYYGVSFHSFTDTQVQMEWYQKNWLEGTGIAWKIIDKTTLENVGVITVYLYKPEHSKAEVGFWLLPAYWNKGFALEALQSVIRYWQLEKQLHRLEAFVETGNMASTKLLEKAGFAYEGTMRDCELKNGKYISLLVYALIAKAE